MKLVKFYIYKIKPNYREIKSFDMKDIHDFNTVGIISYFIHKRKGWNLNSIEFFMISKIYFSWRDLSLANKIPIIALIIGISITIVLFIIDKIYFKN